MTELTLRIFGDFLPPLHFQVYYFGFPPLLGLLTCDVKDECFSVLFTTADHYKIVLVFLDIVSKIS